MIEFFSDKQNQKAWKYFVQEFDLDEDKQQKFYQYATKLIEENQKYNLTAIVDYQAIIKDHFQDSLSLLTLLDIKVGQNFADIGSGGGFPGIPLAIMLPESTFYLVEVQQKKLMFLQMIIDELGLTNVILSGYDFRTFLRLVHEPIDYFTARASLHCEELIRVLKPSSFYHKSILIYWASKNWIPTDKEKVYLDKCLSYKVGSKKRSLCIFRNKD